MMKVIKFNGISFPHPKNFAMSKVPNIVNEVTTLMGRDIADINGWKWQDVNLSWDWIDSDVLEDLADETDPMNGTFTMQFDNPSGGTTTVNAMRTGFAGTKIATITPDGKVQWSGIEMAVTFPDCYFD